MANLFAETGIGKHIIRTHQALANLFPLRHYFLIYVDQALNGYPMIYSWVNYVALLIFMMLPFLIAHRLKGALVYYKYMPLIELGAGFDLELTARENVFLNGAVLGHDRDYMEAHFNNIIDFAELWDFVDVPVKNYSSGMIARLGFSIATEVEAEILACDEILSVGDFMFQQKCHDRMEKMLSGGTTLLFVSHDINQVKQLCKRAIWIDLGHLRGDGPAAEVCDAYVAAMQRGE